LNKKTLKVLEYNKIIDRLAEKAESQLGKDEISDIKPLDNKNAIEGLLMETEEALTLIIKKGNPPLYGIHNIKNQVKRAEIGGSLTPENLLKICDMLRVSRNLKRFIKEAEEDGSYPIIKAIIDSLRVYRHIEEKIDNAIVDGNEISDNASPNLRSIRRTITNTNESVRKKLDSIVNSSRYKKYLQDNIVTMREGRYVIPVKQESRGSVSGLVHDISASGATVFIEPMSVVDLNNELRELEIKERKEIERILEELSNMVATESRGIIENQGYLKDLDIIFAKGKLALEMEGTKPILNDKGYINIKKARHPILDPKEVVAIDAYIGDEFTSLIITGPNTGGKTVSLKTIGLLTLMAQSGLHIPAAFDSEIAVFDHVFADIGDEQSIEQSLSTFSSHMTNIVDILNNVESNSLLLFDELGAGTDPTEGAALAMSILDHLLQLDVRTIATTHYSQLKLYALTTENVNNASVEFDVETLKPTYRLLIGVPGKSNAFDISKRLGIQDYIIKYAKELISKENIEFEDVLQAIEEDRKEIEKDKEESKRLRYQIEKLEKDLAFEKDKTDEIREEIIRNAKIEARDIIREAKKDSDILVSELRGISSEVGKERNRRIQESQELIKTKLSDVENSIAQDVLDKKSSEPPQNLKIGENVKVLSLGQNGQIMSLPNEDGDVDVQVGIMKVNVHIDNLKRIDIDKREDKNTGTKTIISFKSKDIKNEIDLRGQTIEEAIYNLDKYLDDSYIAGLNEVYIIHGKGSGALRQGLREYLNNHRSIKKTRLGKYGEGGTGVTVVQLK